MLQLYNSLTQRKETFTPISEKKVSMYVCGITPYDTTHLGHAFTYLIFDTLLKYLSYSGYEVTYTQNVTDINDRDSDILRRAKEQQQTWQDLAKFWTDKFLSDMESVHWTKPTHYLWASKEIPSMISIIQRILDNGYGYSANGSVYLDITKFPTYGNLSHLTHSHMIERAKEFEEDLQNPDKKHPLDITLWRSTQPKQDKHIPSFESPFGPGRPGWHIECSAMSTSSLSEQIDIHGGGIDLIYPHHESEIAQSEAATGKSPFVKYWIHVNLVQKDHQKMSKSLGNLVLVSDLLKKYSANAIRWYIVSHHYRTSWNFDEKELQLAQTTVDQLEKQLHTSESHTTSQDLLLKSFEDHMDNDLDVPSVLQLIRSIISKPSLVPEEKKSLALIAQTLGFTFQ